MIAILSNASLLSYPFHFLCIPKMQNTPLPTYTFADAYWETAPSGGCRDINGDFFSSNRGGLLGDIPDVFACGQECYDAYWEDYRFLGFDFDDCSDQCFCLFTGGLPAGKDPVETPWIRSGVGSIATVTWSIGDSSCYPAKNSLHPTDPFSGTFSHRPLATYTFADAYWETAPSGACRDAEGNSFSRLYGEIDDVFVCGQACYDAYWEDYRFAGFDLLFGECNCLFAKAGTDSIPAGTNLFDNDCPSSGEWPIAQTSGSGFGVCYPAKNSFHPTDPFAT